MNLIPLNAATQAQASSDGSTLASSLATKLRKAITSGTIPPGTKLRLEELRATFQVSLSPLREALARLSAEGFVVAEEQRGYRVAPVSRSNLAEVTRLRLEFECLALREAIAAGDDVWEGQLVAALHRLNKLRRPTRDEESVDEWQELHRMFHATLIEACKMPLLLAFCTTLHDLNNRYRYLFLTSRPTMDRNVAREHEKIAEAAVARDTNRACELLSQHIERTGKNILCSIEECAIGP